MGVQHKNGLNLGTRAAAQTFCGFPQYHTQPKGKLYQQSGKQQLRQNFSNSIDFLPLKPKSVDNKIARPCSTVVNTQPSVYQIELRNFLKIVHKQTKAKIIYMNVNYRIRFDPYNSFSRVHQTEDGNFQSKLGKAITK